MKILEFDELPSTNNYAKSHITEGDMIIIARSQTLGRGTKGRAFHSAEGGLYLSKLLHYNAFPASRVFEIMLNTSVAVCRTLEEFRVSPTIKWPNDIYVNGRKICGILIENTFSGLNIATSIVGIGLNINNTLPEELKNIAVTMSEVGQKQFDIAEVKNRLIYHLGQSYSVAEYKRYIFFFNQKILLSEQDGLHEVTALDVDEYGRLIVEEKGSFRTVTAGEVSVLFS